MVYGSKNIGETLIEIKSELINKLDFGIPSPQIKSIERSKRERGGGDERMNRGGGDKV